MEKRTQYDEAMKDVRDTFETIDLKMIESEEEKKDGDEDAKVEKLELTKERTLELVEFIQDFKTKAYKGYIEMMKRKMPLGKIHDTIRVDRCRIVDRVSVSYAYEMEEITDAIQQYNLENDDKYK